MFAFYEIAANPIHGHKIIKKCCFLFQDLSLINNDNTECENGSNSTDCASLIVQDASNNVTGTNL